MLKKGALTRSRASCACGTRVAQPRSGDIQTQRGIEGVVKRLSDPGLGPGRERLPATDRWCPVLLSYAGAGAARSAGSAEKRGSCEMMFGRLTGPADDVAVTSS